MMPFLDIIVFPGLLFLLFLAFFCEWLDRKAVAKLQNRVGPKHTGPEGILQPFADFIKLLSNEDIIPAAVDRIMFSLGPILILTLSLMPLFLIPIAGSSALVWFEGDLIFIMFVMTLRIIITFLSAWSSTNRFSMIGGMRVILQMLAFEIPLTIAMTGPAISARSLSLSKIVQFQASEHLLLLAQPLGFVIVTICLLAELRMVPFDIPKAKTEIVKGWFVEFSGKKLALLRLTEDFELVLAASLMVSLYLGGPIGPWQTQSVLYFFTKLVICILILSNLRALFARFRIDQALKGAWKYLTPLALIQVILVELMPMVIP
ncbi:NADH-quinone oxidoreductase subunit H [Candidatus Bathyarchaeota archaeon]|nr:NADH-quinone oxidoreductase subunit H [Candidatus Bathyarchaeota archaeon]